MLTNDFLFELFFMDDSRSLFFMDDPRSLFFMDDPRSVLVIDPLSLGNSVSKLVS